MWSDDKKYPYEVNKAGKGKECLQQNYMKDCIREYFFAMCRHNFASQLCGTICMPGILPSLCCQTKPELPCTKRCIEVEYQPQYICRQLCSRLRIPAHSVIKNICVELLEPCRRRGCLVVCYKVKICYEDCCGCQKEVCYTLKNTCWDMDCCGCPKISLLSDPEYDICGCCLRLSFTAGIKYWPR